jgi:SAM-dependent methyltransferase
VAKSGKMNKYHDFLNPLCSTTTMDVYWARLRVLEALKEQLPNFQGTLLDIGCGRMPYKSIILAPPSCVKTYMGLDLREDLRYRGYNQYGRPDLEWDGHTIPIDSNSVDCAICTEVYEECDDLNVIMGETARVLRPSGLLFFTSPFLWPLVDAPNDQSRYTPFALERHLRDAGFTDIIMKSLGGWNASLAVMIALWVRRGPFSGRKRKILSLIMLPFVRLLLWTEPSPQIFTNQSMITSIAGTAVKPF